MKKRLSIRLSVPLARKLEFVAGRSSGTKSALIERDIDLLQDLARVAHLGISISIPFWDEAKARAIEPFVRQCE